MFRLRTTTTLSLLALAIGIAGTGWLSTQETGWAGPSERVAGFVPTPRVAARAPVERPAPAHRAAHRHWLSDPVVVQPMRLPPAVTVAQADEAPPPPELVPVSIPQAPVSWSQMEGHLHGRVLVRVTIDGSGHVTDATLAQSSGDPVLDAHALASVRDWRFAVPSGYPDGFSANLPMSYTSGDGRVAQAP